MSGSVQDAPREGSHPGVVAARAVHVRAFEQARGAGDVEAMGAAALALAGTYAFGAQHGRVPAFLHEAWSLAGGEQRARLAVALARVWAWAGDASRATSFASEALAAAESLGDDQLLAQALDAQLLVHWGPDDLAARREITARLEDTAAHVADVETRLSAHLWRLTTALETLDLPTVRRQLRALELLAEEAGSARVRFFAASRRAMAGLLTGDLAAAAAATGEAVAAGTEAGEVDTYAIERTLTADLARQAGNTTALAREAATYEAFGLRESVTSVAAQGAVLWVAAGRRERAVPLLHQLAGPDLAGIPRDVDWLLTVTALTEVAVAVGEEALVAAAVRLLEPCAGRGVVNAGGVSFVGVVDDYLAAACRLLGREDEAARWEAAAGTAYRRLGATWWLRRLESAVVPTSTPATGEQRAVVVAHLRAGADGIWWVGRDGAVAPVREAKGLRYLQYLLARPGVDVPALELSDAVAGHPGSGVDEAATGELLDRRALLAYRSRLAELDEELEEAHAWADEGRLDALVAEREALLEQLRGATGLGGRAREAGATAEKARVAVRKAVAAAIDRVAVADASLGRLLRDTVSTGRACRYEPDPDRPVRWVLR
ncbi:MAG: hypothetical protein ACXVYY_06110 [Oryzihumus sp.]